MTANDGLDRALTDWLQDETAPRARDGAVDAFAARVPATRQRPAWATTERWASLETRARFGATPRAVVVGASILLLTLLVAATIAIGASLQRSLSVLQRSLPDPFGPAGNGLIVYSTADSVWAVELDGEGPRRLTPDDEFAAAVYWSLDGTRFSYESLASSLGDGCTGQYSPSSQRCEPPRNAGPEVRAAPLVDVPVPGTFVSRQVIVREADGTNRIVLTNAVANTPGPHSWSPDGERLAFSRSLTDPEDMRPPCSFAGAFCGSRIFVASTDGERFEQVGDPVLDAISPVWSQQGDAIYFVGSPAGTATDYRLYRMDADGTDLRLIGDPTTYHWEFQRTNLRTIDLSPAGDAIVSQFQGQIFTMDVATGEARQLTYSFEHDSASWSPDGTQILVTRYNGPGGRSRPVIIDVQASAERELDVWIDGARWSPDGTSIVGRAWDDASVMVVDLTDEGSESENARLLETSERAIAVDWQRVAP